NFITFQEFANDYNGKYFASYDEGDIIYIQDIIIEKKSDPLTKEDAVKFESANDTWALWSFHWDEVWEGFEVGHEIVITLHVLYNTKESYEYCEEIDHESMSNLPYRVTNKTAVKHASPSISIISPGGDEDWSGNSNHTITYNVSGGAPPYTVNFSYSIDHTNWTTIKTLDSIEPGDHTYNWTTDLIDSENVSMMINVTDNVSETGFDVSENFTIDSTPPEIMDTSPADKSSAPLGSAIMIIFDESMDNASVESAFSITPDPGGWSWEWVSENKMIWICMQPFEYNRQYTCTVNVSVKDNSEPGNYMVSNYSWSFTAQPGIGDFNVTSDYPKNAEAGKECQVVVEIRNSEYAENRSGALFIRFYKRTENGTFTMIGEAQFAGGMLPCENATVCSYIFSFEETGNNYIKINVTSTNPLDKFGNKNEYYEVTYTVNVYPSPVGTEKETISWEDLENIRILVVVIMVFLIIILFYLMHIHRFQGRKKEKGIYGDFENLKKLSYIRGREK
ncbi:MAG: Ig-like domain-containing protein, partial [Candidatus Thermoplasmatota archaeon]|nr:Ig-like domain-containing protein [Candidatus Thermoplasmatota archaeon]MCG2826797.1 Ig-like domain-containing protein [Thermoplasmatales archaeon]